MSHNYNSAKSTPTSCKWKISLVLIYNKLCLVFQSFSRNFIPSVSKDNSPLDCKINPVNPKGNQPWIFTESTDAEAEAPIFWPPDAKSWLMRKDPDAGKDWRQETEDKMVGWDHRLNGHEFEQALGDGEQQGSLACCSPWGHKESDTTEQLNNSNQTYKTRWQHLPAFLGHKWQSHCCHLLTSKIIRNQNRNSMNCYSLILFINSKQCKHLYIFFLLLSLPKTSLRSWPLNSYTCLVYERRKRSTRSKGLY